MVYRMRKSRWTQELNEADGQEADIGHEKDKKASGAVVPLIQGLSGENRLADAEGFSQI